MRIFEVTSRIDKILLISMVFPFALHIEQILFGRLLIFDLDYLYLFFAAPVFDLAVFGLFASNLALFGLVFAQLFVICLLHWC